MEHKLLVSYRTPPHFSCCHGEIARSQALSLALISCCMRKAVKMAGPAFITQSHCLHCLSPQLPPHLSSSRCGHCTVAVQTGQLLCHSPAPPPREALFWGDDSLARQPSTSLPASISCLEHEQKVAWLHLSERMKGDWNSYQPWKSRRKVLAEDQAVHKQTVSSCRLRCLSPG